MFRDLIEAIIAVALMIGCEPAVLSQVSTSSKIRVGANIRVSTDASREHAEVHVATDPQNPNHIAACSMVEGFPGAGTINSVNIHTILYVSYDRGRTWESAVEDPAPFSKSKTVKRDEDHSWDPTCEYDREGRLYFGTGTHLSRGVGRTRLYRSPDGGRTWFPPTLIAPDFEDKPLIVTDTQPKSPNRGRLYVYYCGVRSNRATSLISSTDHGTSFTSPSRGEGQEACAPMSGAVLSDGTLVLVGAQSLVALISTDSGQSFRASRIAPTPSLYIEPLANNVAVDSSNGPFHDRIYVAWDAPRGGRRQVFVAYSNDRGFTWSAPKVVNDDEPRLGGKPGPDDFMPTIAVNREGVVGISWYDRRDNPDNRGYYVRFSASHDGGQTWRRSVRVSDRANTSAHPLATRRLVSLKAYYQSRDADQSTLETTIGRFTWIAGHFAGLAVAADGTFHCLWVDNRTGIKQLWTASIKVPGQSRRDPPLIGLQDITNTVSVAFEGFKFLRTDMTSGTITGNLYITNLSSEIIRTPLRLQVVGLHLEVAGAPATADLDHANTKWMGSEIWDCSGGLVGGVLLPRATSVPVPIRLRLTGLKIPPLLESDLQRVLSLKLKARIFGSKLGSR